MRNRNENKYQEWINRSSTTCPGFGLIAFGQRSDPSDGSAGDTDRIWNADEGVAVYDGYRPNWLDAERQHPLFLGVNSEVPVAPGKPGQFTVDWDATALIEKNDTIIGPGVPCGPVDDQWEISPKGTAFMCVALDERLRGCKRAIIAPNTSFSRHAIAAYSADATVSAGGGLFDSVTLIDSGTSYGATSSSASCFSASPNGIKVLRSCVVSGEIHCSLKATADFSTEVLDTGFRLNVLRSSIEYQTPFIATASWHGDYNKSGYLIDSEPEWLPIAMHFSAIRLRKNDTLIPRYTGSADASLKCGYMIVRLQGGEVIQSV